MSPQQFQYPRAMELFVHHEYYAMEEEEEEEEEQVVEVEMEMERTKVQKLYDACDVVFSCGMEQGAGGGLLPPSKQIEWLQDLLDAIEPVDVGIDGSGAGEEGTGVTSDGSGDDESSLSDDSSHASSRRKRRRMTTTTTTTTRRPPRLMSGHAVKDITYIHIHECDDFSIGIFCFPAGARLPLHDHPEMVVLSKVLYGSLSWKAFDWVAFQSNSKTNKKNGLARIVADEVVLDASSRPSVLFPSSGGNMHSFTALTPCAILDVLTPPYSDELGRPSTYFAEVPIPSLVPGYAALQEMDLPEDLVVVGAPYLGPELVVVSDSEYSDSDSY